MLKQFKISTRIPEPLKRALEARAKREQETSGEITRRALEAFLGPPKRPQQSD